MSIAQSGQETFNWGALSLMRPFQGKPALAFGVGRSPGRAVHPGGQARKTKGGSGREAKIRMRAFVAWHLTQRKSRRSNGQRQMRRGRGKRHWTHGKNDGHMTRCGKNVDRSYTVKEEGINKWTNMNEVSEGTHKHGSKILFCCAVL